METCKFRLSLPPSENKLYEYSCYSGRRGREPRARVYLSEAYVTWRAIAELEMFQQNVPKWDNYYGKIKVELDFYFPDNRCDLDNFDKAVLDSISPRMRYNDNRVTELVLRKFIDKRHPRVEVTVIAAEDAYGITSLSRTRRGPLRSRKPEARAAEWEPG